MVGLRGPVVDGRSLEVLLGTEGADCFHRMGTCKLGLQLYVNLLLLYCRCGCSHRLFLRFSEVLRIVGLCYGLFKCETTGDTDRTMLNCCRLQAPNWSLFHEHVVLLVVWGQIAAGSRVSVYNNGLSCHCEAGRLLLTLRLHCTVVQCCVRLPLSTWNYDLWQSLGLFSIDLGTGLTARDLRHFDPHSVLGGLHARPSFSRHVERHRLDVGAQTWLLDRYGFK